MFQEPEDYVQLKNYAGPFSENITDNMELFLFRMAPDLIDPSSLINKEIVISKKQNTISVKGKMVEIEAQKGISLKNLTLMIPNSTNGDLIAVDKNISCQVILKKAVTAVTIANELDPNLFQSVTHQIPKLTRRDFYESAGVQTERVQSTKKAKHKKKNLETSLCNGSSSRFDDEDATLNSSISKVKKNKKRKRDESPLRFEDDPINSSVKKEKSSQILIESSSSLDTTLNKKKKKRKLETFDG